MNHTDSALLLDRLAAQQDRILGIVSDLDEDAMHRVLLPSGWSCAGMLQHLTSGIYFWCASVMNGRPEPDLPDDFVVPAGTTAADLVEAYARTARECADLVRGLPLSTPPAWWPDGRWGPWRLTDLHEVLIHLVVETSTHAGHLDIARELIDRHTWDYAQGRLTAA